MMSFFKMIVHRQAMRQFVALTLCGSMVSPVFADVVTMKGGTVLRGRVTESGKAVYIHTAKLSTQVDRERIESIELESDDLDYLHIAAEYLALKNFERAIEYYRMVLEIDPQNVQAQEGQAACRRELLKKRPLKGPLGAIHKDVLAGDLKRAEERLVSFRLPEKPNEDEVDALVDIYTAFGVYHLDRIEHTEADANLTKALELNPAHEPARQAMEEIWKRNPRKREELLGLYLDRLKADPENLVLNAKIADLLVALGRHQDALPHFRLLVKDQRYASIGYQQQYRTALSHLITNDKRDQPARWATLNELAAEEGDMIAMHNMGLVYEKGFGRASDQVKATEWFVEAAMNRNNVSMLHLARRFRDGVGAEVNESTAIRWLGASASIGNNDARTELYEYVESKNPEAMYFYALLDLTKDESKYQESLNLLKESSELGYEPAGVKYIQVQEERANILAAYEERQRARAWSDMQNAAGLGLLLLFMAAAFSSMGDSYADESRTMQDEDFQRRINERSQAENWRRQNPEGFNPYSRSYTE